MITDIFFWIGVVTVSLFVLIPFSYAMAYLSGWVYGAFYHGQKLYKRSKLCKKMSDKGGYLCATWLIDYDLRNGNNRGKYTVRDWERHFFDKIKGYDRNTPKTKE